MTTKITDLPIYSVPNSSLDLMEIVDVANNTSKRVTPLAIIYYAFKNGLIAGSNISITSNDTNNTLTISS